MRRVLTVVLVLGLALGAMRGAMGDTPAGPPNPVADAYKAGKVEVARELSAQAFGAALKRAGEERAIEALDPAALEYGDALRTAIVLVSERAHFEAQRMLDDEGTTGEFLEKVWKPLWADALKVLGPLDKAIAQAQGILDRGDAENPGYRQKVLDWKQKRDGSMMIVAFAAGKAQRPDLVKEIFARTGALGSYANAEDFLLKGQNPRQFGMVVDAVKLTEAEEKALRGVLAKWFGAVEKRDKKAFAELYVEKAQGERMVEKGVFDELKRFKQVDAFAGQVAAARRNDGSLSLAAGFPCVNERGEKDFCRRQFTVVKSGESWKMKDPNDDGISQAEKEKIRRIVEDWYQAVNARDWDKLAGMYDRPGEAKELFARRANEIAGQTMDISGATLAYKLNADGSIGLEIESIKVTDASGKTSNGGGNRLVLVRSGEGYRIVLDKKEK